MNTRTEHRNPRTDAELADMRELRDGLAQDEKDLFAALREAARRGTDTPDQRQALLDQYTRTVEQFKRVDGRLRELLAAGLTRAG